MSRPSDGSTVEDPRAALRQRPTMSEITGRYERMQQEVRDRLAAELGLGDWGSEGAPVRSACVRHPEVADAEQRNLVRWSRPGIPDEQWPEAVRIAGTVAAEHGFSELEVITDRAGDHKVAIRDGFGGRLHFGTAARTVLAVRTGCHLVVEP
ncbi:LppA family lipoprotein [Saccharopolyspora cebuensis]|uniref:LppA family lipoprotein n=1 Tax=Saccharopolyspora cebuensis TaxID=418759 RepID=A0ABV4CPC9_9PSEU